MQPSSIVDCVVSGAPDDISATATVQTAQNVKQEARPSITVSYINIAFSDEELNIK